LPDLTPQSAELDPRSDPAWGEHADEDESEVAGS